MPRTNPKPPKAAALAARWRELDPSPSRGLADASRRRSVARSHQRDRGRGADPIEADTPPDTPPRPTAARPPPSPAAAALPPPPSPATPAAPVALALPPRDLNDGAVGATMPVLAGLGRAYAGGTPAGSSGEFGGALSSPSGSVLSGVGTSGSVRNVDLIELRALRAKFAELDEDHNGIIDREAFTTLFSSVVMLPEDVPEEERAALLDFAYALFEPGGSETLHLRQFVVGCMVLSRGTEMERLRYLFQMYDSDKSGGLSLDELVRVFRVMKSYAGAKRAVDGKGALPITHCGGDAECEARHLAAKAMREHDVDKDGQLAFDEFAQWCAAEPDTKVWLDMLSLDTARGVARLREERERAMIMQELTNMGFGGGDEIFREGYSLVEAAASSSGCVDPTISMSVDYPPLPGNSDGANNGQGLSPLRRTVSHRDQAHHHHHHHHHQTPQSSSVIQSSQTTDEDGTPTDESQQRPSGGSSLHSSFTTRAEPDESPYQVQRSVSGRPAGPFEIDFQSITLIKQIGQGSFARVWRGKWLDIPVAVKILKTGPKLRLSPSGVPLPSNPAATEGDVGNAATSGGPGSGAVGTGGGGAGAGDPIRQSARMYGGSILDETLEPEMASNYDLESQGGGDVARDSVSATANNAGAVRDRNHFMREIGLLTSLRHPNVLLLMGACTDPSYPLCIVSELVEGGSLQNHLHGLDRRRISPRKALKLALDIARGMLYLHSSKPIVLHRDLKAANILVENFEDEDSCKAIIIDFGLSRLDSTTDSQFGGMAGGMVGSLVTMAPECMRGEMYQPASDVYSFAIIMQQLFSGRQPFANVTAVQLMFKVGIEGKRPEFHAVDNIPASVAKLIQECWAQDLSLRPDFEKVVAELNCIHKELFLDEAPPPPKKTAATHVVGQAAADIDAE